MRTILKSSQVDDNFLIPLYDLQLFPHNMKH